MARKPEFKTCTVNVRARDFMDDSTTKQEGVCYRGLALIPDQRGTRRLGWKIVHAPTGLGLGVPPIFKTATEGKKALVRIGDAADWSNVDPENQDELSRLAKILSKMFTPKS